VTFRRRIAWLVLFATAFGFLEAAVVVYLRELTYPEGFAFPLRLLPERLGWIELARESATIVMLAAAAALAATGFWGRFGAFAVAFGVWDLLYYAGLRLLLEWPQSWSTWDVLFLIPGIWTGPVASAAGVAVLLVVCGALMWRRAADGHAPRPRAWHLGAAILALVLLLAAFLANHSLVLAGGVPVRFPWPLWAAGVAVALTAFGDLFLRRG
jgi:hypothetical protein